MYAPSANIVPVAFFSQKQYINLYFYICFLTPQWQIEKTT